MQLLVLLIGFGLVLAQLRLRRGGDAPPRSRPQVGVVVRVTGHDTAMVDLGGATLDVRTIRGGPLSVADQVRILDRIGTEALVDVVGPGRPDGLRTAAEWSWRKRMEARVG